MGRTPTTRKRPAPVEPAEVEPEEPVAGTSRDISTEPVSHEPTRAKVRKVKITALKTMVRQSEGRLASELNRLRTELRTLRNKVQRAAAQSTVATPQIDVPAPGVIEPSNIRSQDVIDRTLIDSRPPVPTSSANLGNHVASINTEERATIYNIKNINIEKPKYGGQSSMHPVDFLENLETYIRKAGRETSEVETIVECLEGTVRDWARIYRDRWTNLADFKTDFLLTYWGTHEQSNLRRSLVHGTWDSSETMLNYFLRLVGRAKMLNHKIPEIQLVSDIIRHFPRYVQQSFITSKISTIIETAELLRSTDEVNKQEIKPTRNVEPTNKVFDKRRKEIQRNYNNWNRPAGAQGNSKGVTALQNSADDSFNWEHSEN